MLKFNNITNDGNLKNGDECWQEHLRYTNVINPDTSGIIIQYS